MRNYKFIFLLSLFFYGCSSDEGKPAVEDDYLIFGHFYGFCIGDGCVEIFKIDDEKLYEDSNDNYANAPFDFKLLDNDKFEQVKDLVDYFPMELLSEKEDILGCPDCSDGGGIFIEYSKNGTTKSWRIDQFKENVPDYLSDFIDKVNEKISLINK